MKFIKYFIFLLIALVIISIIYIATFSSSYDVHRSKTIKAPISNVFNTVNDLKTWEKWGPWHENDSTIVVKYGEKTVGVGAMSSWTSKEGPGKMETVSVTSNKSINQKITFGDFEPGDIYWNFEEVKDGTKVTWGMKADNNPFIFKFAAALSGGWDAMFGPMEKKGLNNLEKTILENMNKAPKFKLSEITTVDLAEKTFIGYLHHTKIDHDEMTKLFMQDMPKAGMYAVSKGLKHNEYTPGAVYTKYDEKTNETEFYIGLLLHKAIEPAEGMQTVNLSEGQSVVISKFGNYGVGDYDAHMKIDEYLKENNLTQKWPIWELYMNDPGKVKPEEIQTDIYYPVK